MLGHTGIAESAGMVLCDGRINERPAVGVEADIYILGLVMLKAAATVPVTLVIVVEYRAARRQGLTILHVMMWLSHGCVAAP